MNYCTCPIEDWRDVPDNICPVCEKPPRTNPIDWDTYFMQLAKTVSLRSKDPNTQLGCVIVGPDKTIRSTGYNSFVRGLNDNVPERYERPEKYWWIEHAERNAIYNAKCSLEGCTIYLPSLPCIDCTKAIVSVGITEIVNSRQHTESWIKHAAHYKDHIDRMYVMLEECGVKMRSIDFDWSL